MVAKSHLTTIGDPNVRENDRQARLMAALEHAAHTLPEQGPIGVFVHHNTLHAFAHLPFHQAVLQAAELFGAEPYMSEAAFRSLVAAGRITPDDLEHALAAEFPGDAVLVEQNGWSLTRRELGRLALLHDLAAETPEGLGFRLGEQALDTRLGADLPTEKRERIIKEGVEHVRGLCHAPSRDDASAALARLLSVPGVRPDKLVAAVTRALARDPEALAVKALWLACRTLANVPGPRPALAPARDTSHRDLLVELGARDVNELVNPVLIRLCSAFVDQGMAYWPMPDRDRGFYTAVRSLLVAAPRSPEPWLRAAADDFADQAARGDRSMDAALGALAALGVDEGSFEPYLTKLLGALPGWAGMMHRLERHPDERPAGVPAIELLDYLAVRLVLERAAVTHVARADLGWKKPLAGLAEHGRQARACREPEPGDPRPGDHDRAYRLFRVLCLCGVSAARAASLNKSDACAVLDALDHFPGTARRRVFQEAYERCHRRQILDALADNRRHARLDCHPDRRPAGVRFQVICCIDEREGSLRRHLEEVEPAVETFGAAGFFGVAMDFRGLDDAHPVPLCPVVQTPAHEVEEIPHEDDAPLHARRVSRRKLWARIVHNLVVGSRSLVRGHLLTLALGHAAAVPMTTRVLFPRAAGRLRRRLAALFLPNPRTVLRGLRPADADRSERGKFSGFTLDEIAQRVASLLQGIGLTRDLAPLVVVLGHGSTSLNNPHESAHDCGACSGRRGGPNARLFADMANRPEVRAALREHGVNVPDTTWFVGGMHDTASDAVTLYDIEAVPERLAGELGALLRVLDQARALDAHERCRRFASAADVRTPARALRHVEARADHLAEPRPEYGHASNAICIVGRRALTRGLFLDRRAFLVSYDPTRDPDSSILEQTLAAVGPVGAGINLEYYFSFVDNERYGCGTKLPHNVTGHLGVMNGSCSDLRTGLPWQMVEIHEPVRLLTIVEARPETLLAVAARRPEVGELVENRWIQLVAMDPDSGAMHVLDEHGFVPYTPAQTPLPVVGSSMEWYRGRTDHLAPARIVVEEKGAPRHAA